LAGSPDLDPSGEGCILAIDTATRRLSVAVVSPAGCLASIQDDDDRIHSERLLPAVDSLLRELGLSVRDLAGVALSVGPGSFTGLRIGLATVKGLTFGGGPPVVAVSTLAGLCLATDPSAKVRGALLDARRGEAYAGWCSGQVPRQLANERVYTPEELAAEVPAGCVLAVGEDAESFAEALAQRVSVERIPAVRADAERIGELGLVLLARGEGAPADALVPRYVRRAEAEVKRTGKRFEER